MSNKVNGKRYDDNFKEQIVLLIKSGKETKAIAKEYNIARTTVNNWISNYNNSGLFKKSDNMSELEKELIKVKKELKQARMENDILKQAALIMAQK